MILTGEQIKGKKLVNPCVSKQKGFLSFGLEPSGYTLRLGNKFAYPDNTMFEDAVLDPAKPPHLETLNFTNLTQVDSFVLQPQHYILGASYEYIKLPNNITAFAFTKSTYARLGVFCNITTIDAGWEGYLTIEIANLGSTPVKIYPYFGIAEIVFFEHEETEGYEGKYQKITEPVV